MSTRSHELSHFKTDRLLANIVVVHEASRHHSPRGDLPKHLAAALGASSVSIAFLELNAERQEARRTIYSTDFSIDTPEAAPTDVGDWVAPLLREATAVGVTRQVENFGPALSVHAFYPIDPASAIAFNLHFPAPVHLMMEGMRPLLTSLLAHIALNLRCQATSTVSPVRSMPLLKSLTKAEWRVLHALDSDASEKEIASNLGTTANTLHSHIKSIYRRMGVQSRLSAIAILRRAERETLIAELQNEINSDTSSSTPPSPGHSGRARETDQSHAPLALPAIREVPFHSNPHLSFLKGDARAG